MNRLNKLTALAAAVALSGGLVACGGGGGSTEMQTPQEICESAGNTWVDGACMTDEQLAAAAKAREATAIANAIAAAKTAVDGLTDASSDADIMAASNAITAAHNAITGAQHASAADTADSLDELATIRMDLTTAQGGIDEHRQAAKDAANKVALSKEAAIKAPASNVRPFDGGDAIPNNATSNASATTMYGVSVEHTGSAVEIGVRDQRNLMDADPKFAKMAEFGNGQMLVRNIGTEREIIVVHTDIDAPTPTPFTTEHPLNANDDPDTTPQDFRSLTIITDAQANPNHLSFVDLRVPKANKNATRTDTFTQDDSTTTNADEGEHPGEFNGALGTYDCTSTGCTVTVNDKGETTAMAGTWTFTPNAGVTVDVQDRDYMTYGFWLDTTTKDGAIASYDAVQTFAMSSLDPTNESLDEVTGTATYNGDAAGVYVHKTKNEDGTLDTATSGRFTADVALTAYFDETTLRNANTIGGSISNFDLDGGPANSWNVDISASISDSFALQSGVASGMDGDTGSLSGQFHGTAVDRDGAGSGTALAAPPVLIGEFNANFVNGSAAGAYGARAE